MAGILTATQRRVISELVQLHHAALMVEFLGDGAVSKSMLATIKAKGLYKTPRMDIIRRAFQYGRESIVTPKILEMGAEDFERFIKSQGDLLSSDEREMIDALRESFSAYLKSLSDAMESKLRVALLKADKRASRMLAQRQRPDAFLEVTRRKVLATIAKDLSEITEAQIGNASRVTVTETNNAYQDGRAQEIIRKSGDRDPNVFKQPRHDACEECVRLYLEDDGKTPKVFKMSELIANGTNIGKAKGSRDPVIDSVHPHCACSIYWLPPGFGFDVEGRMTYLGRGAVA